MRDKGFSALEFLIVVLILAVAAGAWYFYGNGKLEEEVKVEDMTIAGDVNSSTIYYLNDGVLYQLAPLSSGSTAFLPDVDTYSVSPRNNKLVYTLVPGEVGQTVEATLRMLFGGDDFTFDTETWAIGKMDFSSDGNYLVIDSGTSSVRSYRVVALFEDYEIVSEFSGAGYVWMDEEAVLMNDLTEVDPERPWETGQGSSISEIEIHTGETDRHIEADALNDYSIIRVEGDCLYYKRTQVESQEGWSDASLREVTYYCMDLDENESTEVEEDVAVEDMSEVEDALDQIASGYESYRVVTNEDHDGWVVVEVDGDIVLFKLSDPTGTFKKLATGSQVSWF